MNVSLSNIESIQKELNDVIINHTNDPTSLLEVASVLFSSSLKCYNVILGKDGMIKFLEQTLTKIREDHTIDVRH